MLEKEEWHDHNQRDMPVDIQSWNTGGPRTSSSSSSSSCDDQDRHDKYYWHVIQRQLSQCKQQQASLMEFCRN